MQLSSAYLDGATESGDRSFHWIRKFTG